MAQQPELRAIVGESEENIAAVIKRLSPQAPAAPATPERTWGDTAADVAIGAAKGVGNTVFGLGKMVRDYTPVGYISDAILPGAFDQRPPEITPTNTAQRVGFTAEQVGEFFLPTGAARMLPKAVAELGKSGALTKAQTGDSTAAGVSMALTAAVPGAGALVKAGKNLRQGAEKSVAQALGATKETHKATAAKIAPTMLEKGVGGSRAGMLERAESELASVGPKIAAAEQAAVQAGKTVPGQVVRGELQFAAEGLMVPNAQGVMTAVPGSERVVKRLQKLDEFVATLGDDIPFDKAAQIKRAWDQLVSKSGLYTNKATASAADNASAWATREGASAFRRLLNDASPDLAALNKEYAFWKGLKDVLKATEARTQAQSGGLVSSIGGVTGAASGFASGDSLGDSVEKALIGGVAGRQLIKLLQSPAWRTKVSAPMKYKLSQALSSGKADEIQKTARHIIEALPAQLRPMPEPAQ
jgi:hypothetical protein